SPSLSLSPNSTPSLRPSSKPRAGPQVRHGSHLSARGIPPPRKPKPQPDPPRSADDRPHSRRRPEPVRLTPRRTGPQHLLPSTEHGPLFLPQRRTLGQPRGEIRPPRRLGARRLSGEPRRRAP